MELVSEAMVFAAKAHDGMRRKQSNIPYILHPAEAAAIVGSLTDDPEVIAAAVLHDVVEDAGIAPSELEERFGKRVAELVASETEDKQRGLPPEQTWRLRKQHAIDTLRSAEDDGVRMLYLGDKLANMRSIYQCWLLVGDAVWQGFHQKDPAQHGWYYREIAEAVRDFEDTLAWKEFDGLIKTVFEKGEAK